MATSEAMTGDGDIVERKAALRRTAAERRDRLHAGADATVGADLIKYLSDPWMPPAGAVVSGFWPFRSEIDLCPLLTELHGRGARVCLPVVAGKAKPLIFRHWWPGMELAAGNFGVLTPPPQAEQLRPDWLLIPLLAFDVAGCRLGYGGGFYDRTLQELRSDGRTVAAIGVAYAGQQVDEVPRVDYDQPLNAILTERGLIEPEK